MTPTVFVLAALAIAAVVGAVLLGEGTTTREPPTPATAQTAVAAPAPELRGGPWLNTPGQASLRLRDRLGKVTIVHFWTFG